MLLHGRYEILSPIASGGMASVHLGRVVGMGGFERLVAIKRMHPHLLAETEYMTMFLDEARLAARIRHPNVVATLDVAESDEGPFIVMEFIEGPTLAQMLKAYRTSDGVMPFDVSVGIFSDTLSGLHAAHELTGADRQPLGLVHRDVSPQNIMVGRDGVARITDFGVAKANVRLSSTRSGFLKGKLAYLAPEQVRGEAIDRRADVYAAGVVLWEMLTSQRLFRADTEANLMWLLMQGADRTPREQNPEVPEAIDAVCMKALAMDPDERFATCAAFLTALEQAAMSSGIHVAKSRRVTELLEELDLPIPSASVPPPDPSVATPSSPSRSSSSIAHPVTAPDAASVKTTAALASSVIESKRGRGGLVLGAAVVFALGVGATVLVMGSGGGDGPTATTPATSGEAVGAEANDEAADEAAPGRTADEASTDDAQWEGAEADATSPDAAASATASSVATTEASAPPRVVTVPKVVSPRPAAPPPPPSPTPPPTGPNADYQPEGL